MVAFPGEHTLAHGQATGGRIPTGPGRRNMEQEVEWTKVFARKAKLRPRAPKMLVDEFKELDMAAPVLTKAPLTGLELNITQ